MTYDTELEGLRRFKYGKQKSDDSLLIGERIGLEQKEQKLVAALTSARI